MDDAEPTHENLAYTIAFDPVGSSALRQMAKMLASSAVRTGFGGDFLIFRNTPEPIFLVQREGIEEIYIETPPLDGEALGAYSMEWKAKAREFIDPRRYAAVMYCDADCLMQRNIDHLFAPGKPWDVLYQPEHGRRIQEVVYRGYLSDAEMKGLTVEGVNGGTWAVKAEHFHPLLEEWDRVMKLPMTQESLWREQSAWNRVLLDSGLRKHEFERHEIQFPLNIDPEWEKYTHAAIIHCLGSGMLEKLEFMFAMYMQKFFYDKSGTLVGLLEM